MEKLLAALSLPQVGDIRLIPPVEDPEKKEGLFALELNTRIYTLRARSDAEAAVWVNTLTKIRQNGIANSPAQSSNPMVKPFATEGSSLHTTEVNGSSSWVKEKRGCLGCC